MNTVFTPDALARSVAKGAFKTCRLADFLQHDCDEAWLFVFPSRDLTNQENGDGDLLEVWDFAADLSSVTTSKGDIEATPETAIYFRD